MQVGYKIAVIVRTQPCAIEGKRNCGRAGIGAGCDVEQRTDHVERGIAKGQRDGVAVFFDEAGLGCDDGGGEFLLVDDLACCKAEGVELLPGRGKDQIFSAVENVDYFRDASEGLRGIVPSADGDSEGVLVGPKGLEAVARVSGDGDGEGVVVDAVAAVLDIWPLAKATRSSLQCTDWIVASETVSWRAVSSARLKVTSAVSSA